MKKPNYLYDFAALIVVFALIIFLIMIAGCDWGQKTLKRWNDQGQLVYYEYTNIGSILKESLIEKGKMISGADHFEITVEGAELKTSDIKATTIYGTLEIE